MGGKARGHYPGTVYHVMLRGNDGRDIFIDEPERIRFYELLGQGVNRRAGRMILPETLLEEPERKRNGGCRRTRQEAGQVRAWAMVSLPSWYAEDLSLTGVGTRLEGDLSNLNEVVNGLRKRVEKNPRSAAELEKIGEELTQIHICEALGP